MMRLWSRQFLKGSALLGLLLVSGCDRNGSFAPVDMWNRSRYKPYEETTFFPDGSTSRPLPANTVARGQLRIDEAKYYGTLNGNYVDTFPFPMTAEELQRGQQRYQIYCQPCHGETGYGDGMIVKRGFSPPPSYHLDRLRKAPTGHFYDVITNGYGAMYSYANRVPTNDRWRIAAYIRVLQRSQNPNAGEVPANANGKLKSKITPGMRRTETPLTPGTGKSGSDTLSGEPNAGIPDTTQKPQTPAHVGPVDSPGAPAGRR